MTPPSEKKNIEESLQRPTPDGEVAGNNTDPRYPNTPELVSSSASRGTESEPGVNTPEDNSVASGAVLGVFSTPPGRMTTRSPLSSVSNGDVGGDNHGKNPAQPPENTEEVSAAGNHPHSDAPPSSRERAKRISTILYTLLASVLVISGVFIHTLSTAAQVSYHPALGAQRDGLAWETPPTSMKEAWRISGYDGLINTPGATIVTTKTALVRIDAATGKNLWKYQRGDSEICHAIEAGGNVAVLFNSGNGCSDITILDAATGERKYHAMYGVLHKDDPARLVFGGEHIALVTPDKVRFLTLSLTPAAEYGTRPDMVYASDQTATECVISDVAVGTRYGVVAAKCAGQSTYHVEAVNLEPEESTQGIIELSIDTKSTEPVTIPMVSYAQVLFATQGEEPTLYAWQLDKDKAEISSEPLKHGEFPRGIWDVPNIGYVWLLGETAHVRYGSEDISQSITKQGVIGNPLPAGYDLLLPTRGGIEVWDTGKDTTTRMDIPGLRGTDFAFSGGTVMSFDRTSDPGEIVGYTTQGEK